MKFDIELVAVTDRGEIVSRPEIDVKGINAHARNMIMSIGDPIDTKPHVVAQIIAQDLIPYIEAMFRMYEEKEDGVQDNLLVRQ